MKFSLSREALLAPIQMIAGVVDRKQTMPILANVLIRADADQQSLSLTGNNLESELIARIQDVEVEAPGQVTADARKLGDICRSLDQNALITGVLQNGRLSLSAGKNRFMLSTQPAEEFPTADEASGDLTLEIDSGLLKGLISPTAFAMANQDVRYYLNGMLLELHQNEIRTVTTDGHRLATAVAELDAVAPFEEPVQVILPRKAVQELSRLLELEDGNVSLTLGSNHARLSLEHYQFTTTLVDGKYPDYRRVIPVPGPSVLRAERSDLKDIFGRAGILAQDNVRGVRVTLDRGQLDIYAENSSADKAEISLPVDFEGEKLSIGFNVSYVSEILSVMEPGQVRFSFSDSNSGVLIQQIDNDAVSYVLMPMKL